MITYYLLARRRNEEKEHPSQADLCFITLVTVLAVSKPLLILFFPFLCFETKSDYIDQAGSQLKIFFLLPFCVYVSAHAHVLYTCLCVYLPCSFRLLQFNLFGVYV